MSFLKKDHGYWIVIFVLSLSLLLGLGERWVRSHAEIEPEKYPSFSERKKDNRKHTDPRGRLENLVGRLGRTEGDTRSKVLIGAVKQLARFHGVRLDKKQRSDADTRVHHRK